MIPRRVVSRVVGVVAIGVAATGCTDSTPGSAERFCGEILANRAELTDPTLEFSDDVEPLLELYRSIGTLAPLSIEEEWDDLVAAYETAATVVPGDPTSEQTALAAIFAAEKSAAAVDRWLEQNCAVDIGPVFTIVAHDG